MKCQYLLASCMLLSAATLGSEASAQTPLDTGASVDLLQLAPSAEAAESADSASLGVTELSGPAIYYTCNGQGVPGWLNNSRALASNAARRLNGLASLSKSQRASAWNRGQEGRWLGRYSNFRFNNVRNRMNGIVKVLGSWRLDVRCKWHKSNFGSASPGIYRITLGGDWKSASSTNPDKPQTFVHEAAHIRGAVLGGEARGKYGIADALKRARKYPGVSVRTAENLGYYAVCRSSIWARRGNCPMTI